MFSNYLTKAKESKKGIISWMCNTHSSFAGNQISENASTSAAELMIIPIRNILLRIANLFQRLLGLV